MIEKSILEDIKEHATVIYQGQPMMGNNDLADYYKITKSSPTSSLYRNKNFFKEGKDYLILRGNELYCFKNSKEGSKVVSKNSRVLYLWTPSGILKQGRIFTNEKSFALFSDLVDYYLQS